MNRPLSGITLETERLLLRPMQVSDIDAMHLIFTDPLAGKNGGLGST
jgi:RimJ/RimL family protein N-acetyltransferase